MAVQNRRGDYNNFDTSKLLPGEWAVVITGDPNASDGRAVYMCFAPGEVKRMATYEDLVEYLEQASGDVVAAELGDVIQTATAAAESATQAAAQAGEATSAALAVQTNYQNNNAASATKLETPRCIGGVEFSGEADISHHGTCGTAAGTSAKVVTIQGFRLIPNACITVRFTYGISAGSSTLNVSGTGAKAINYKGSTLKKAVKSGTILTLVYNGTSWQIVGDLSAEEDRETTLFTGEFNTGSLTNLSLLDYTKIHIRGVTTAGESAPCPFVTEINVSEMYEKEFCLCQVNAAGYLCSAKLLYTGSGGTLTLSNNKAVDLSNGGEISGVTGINICELTGVK